MTTILIHSNPSHLLRLLKVYPDTFQITGTFKECAPGLEAIGKALPDMVFISLDMPEMPCTELLGRLAGFGMELVAVSQWATFAHEATQFGAIGFLTEPIGPSDIVEILPKLEGIMLEKRQPRTRHA